MRGGRQSNQCVHLFDWRLNTCVQLSQVFERLGAIEERMGGSGPTLLRTHPLSAARVTAIEAYLPKVRLQRKYDCMTHI